MNQQTLRSALRALSVMPLALPALALAQPQLEEVVVTRSGRSG